jgi:tRNA modification GTPase
MCAGVDMHGVAVTLLDTAGLRDAADAVERIGVARAHAAAAAADVVVLVYDAQVLPRSS